MYKLLFFIVLPLIFFACENKDTVFIKKIHNQSAKPIYFYFYGNYNPASFGDSVYVAAGELKEILSYTEKNSSVATPQNCQIYDDSVRVVVIGGGNLSKRLQKANDWKYKQEKYSQVCTFEITDADIF